MPPVVITAHKLHYFCLMMDAVDVVTDDVLDHMLCLFLSSQARGSCDAVIVRDCDENFDNMKTFVNNAAIDPSVKQSLMEAIDTVRYFLKRQYRAHVVQVRYCTGIYC
jgi:hypothetical protein